MILKRFLIPFILIAIPVFLGLQSRYQAVPFWEAHKKEFFVNGRPIFTAYDSYLFARYAEDYKKGVFKPNGEDKLRFVPDYLKYPPTVPFYSWLFAELSKIFNKPVENLSFWLIPALAVLFVIPLTLLLLGEGLPFAALIGSLAGAISLIYVVRTSINRLDTDSVIMFFLFSIPLAVYTFKRATSKRERFLAILLLAIFSNLFYWGYLHPGLNFALWIFSIAFLTLPLAVEFFKTKHLKVDRNLLTALGLITLAFNPLILLTGLWSFIEKISKYLFHFEKPIEGNFPNVQISISELQKLDLERLSHFAVGNKFLLLLGFLGIFLLILFRFRFFLLIAPTFLMGLIALKGASRFAMFLAPVLGIGIGFIFDLLWGFLKEKLPPKVEIGLKISLFFVLAGILALANRESFRFKPVPIMNSDIASAFIELGRETPPNAWIFTWWDYGYAIQYYARRATFHDGGSQFSPKTYFVALALTSHSPSVGYNVTKTLEVCGKKCIENLLEEGYKPSQIKELFVSGKLLKDKKPTHPVYWVFTKDLIGKFYWISYFGNWNFKTLKGKHDFIFPTYCVSAKGLFKCYGGGMGFLFDPKRLAIYINGKLPYPVKYFAVRTPNRLEIKENNSTLYGYGLEVVYTYRPGVYNWFLTDLGAFGSNFNQLYILRNDGENYQKWFKRVEERFPDYVFYRLF